MSPVTRKKPLPPPEPTVTPPPSARLFPIVGIGASAGGLEALEQFLSHVPPRSGMAFVVIQHLDPTHKAMLPALLQRITPMPVIEASDQLRVQPDQVYVIPPNTDLSLLHGVLYLFEPGAARGLRLPIDFFFRALAVDREAASVGIILSGMGTDGTLGLRAIKEKGGLTLAQDPETAKFDSMPRSAIKAGLADIIAPAEKLPEQLATALQHYRNPLASPGPERQSDLNKILILLRTQVGHDFSKYKSNTLYRRIERRMGIHLIDRLEDYERFLSENPQETHLLFRELLIGVTSFFRDPEAWVSLKTQVLPAVFARLDGRTQLRAWVSACSSGEEAYSLAMVFKEALDAAEPRRMLTLQIYATDLDSEAIDIARRGVYPLNIAADVAPDRLNRFFVQEEQGYRVSKDLREMVIFAQQNLIADPPFTKLDILTCRNLLIYLTPELQAQLLPLFHYSLNPGGILFLGSAETIGAADELFTALDAKARLYQRSPQPLAFTLIALPSPPPLPPALEPLPGPVVSLQASADRLVLQRFAPAVVLTNAQGDILYINRSTGNYLEPASGKVNWNLHAMAREGLRLELLQSFQEALRNPGRLITQAGFRLTGLQGLPVRINLEVEVLEQPEILRGMVLIVFHELPETPDPSHAPDAPPSGRRTRHGSRTAEQERELQRLKETLQAMHEEMQTSQEELKSTNEELQSANEELQSSNEELTTAKEEMQSLNEELQTVNAELQAKVDDLSRASNDMHNLLNSTGIATVFLDNQLRVRRYTTPATRIIKLIPGDLGRPLSDLATDLCYPSLFADATEVLRTLVFSVKDIVTHDGRWFTVQIMPYRTTENVIEGVVITFVDISLAKRLEAQLRAAGGDPAILPP